MFPRTCIHRRLVPTTVKLSCRLVCLLWHVCSVPKGLGGERSSVNEARTRLSESYSGSRRLYADKIFDRRPNLGRSS